MIRYQIESLVLHKIPVFVLDDLISFHRMFFDNASIDNIRLIHSGPVENELEILGPVFENVGTYGMIFKLPVFLPSVPDNMISHKFYF